MHCRLGDLHGVKMFEVLHCNVVGSKPMMLWGKTWDVALLQSKSAKETDLEFLCENAPKFAASWFAKNKRGELQNSVLEARAGAIHMHTALEQEGFEGI